MLRSFNWKLSYFPYFSAYSVKLLPSKFALLEVFNFKMKFSFVLCIFSSDWIDIVAKFQRKIEECFSSLQAERFVFEQNSYSWQNEQKKNTIFTLLDNRCLLAIGRRSLLCKLWIWNIFQNKGIGRKWQIANNIIVMKDCVK